MRFLLYIKHHLEFLWKILEFGNGVLFRIIFYKGLIRNAERILNEYSTNKYTYRILNVDDLKDLYFFFKKQKQEQYEFFKPHKFDKKTLTRLHKNPSFLMFCIFDNDKIIGYFFLRCFVNKRSFIGRFVDSNYQGQGLGKIMGKILYNIAWTSDFRIFSTISINNIASFNSHKANKNIKIVKELFNDYYLVEFIDTDN
jgi:RimJ/RimL family protein N-acetyltransferase